MDKPTPEREQNLRQTLLFVCTGNTCRSPMAEALAQKILGPEVRVGSAGLGAWDGDVVSEHAIEVIQEQGLDLSRHRARRLSRGMVAEADFIIPMTENQEQILKELYPEFGAKIRRLGSWVASGADIGDPWGGDIEKYRECALQIAEYLEGVRLEKLKPLS